MRPQARAREYLGQDAVVWRESPSAAQDTRRFQVLCATLSSCSIFGVLWVLWTLLKNGISRLLSGFDSIVGGRGWGCGTLALSEVVL